MHKIVIIYPLFYSAKSVDRLFQYINESDYSDDFLVEVLILNSNIDIHKIALQKSQKYKYRYILRDNFGGGEGAIFEVKNRYINYLEMFDFAIYLEESCEPINRKWIRKLIRNLIEGDLINGWHWNWYAKSRENSVKEKIGRNLNYGVISHNPDTNNVIEGVEFYDVIGFRHECIAFRISEFLKLDIGDRELWQNYDKYFFGRSMERIYWTSSKLPKNPNFQFKLLLKQKRLPNLFNTNFSLFREISVEEKLNKYYTPDKILMRRLNLKFTFQIFNYFTRNLIKFMLHRLGYELKSKKAILNQNLL